MGDSKDKETPASLLIVDNEPGNIQEFAQALQGDYQLYFAMNGEQALETVLGQTVDLILLDESLPDRDSLDLLRELATQEPTRRCPVIMVSVTADPEFHAQALRLGAADFVSKPPSPALLHARIESQLRLIRQHRLIEDHAFVDELTELGNQRRFEDALSLLWRSGLRTDRPVGLLLVDIDAFAAYEVHYGPFTARRCLRSIARHLTALFQRPEDVACRIGPSCFAVVTHVEEDEDVVTLLQRALDGLHETRIPHEASPRASLVTVSMGFVRVLPNADYPLERLEAGARQLMEQASADGGNRCCFRDDLERCADFLLPST